MNINSIKKSYIVYFFIVIFILLFLFSLFGIDMTDEGKQMSIAWNIFHGTNNHSYNIYKYGSWYINGLWLSVIGKPFLLWARLGGVILMTLMTLISYLIMKKYQDGKYTLFIIFTALMFIVCENHPETKIDHSNLPTLLVLLSLLFLLFYIRSNFDYQGNYIFIILSSLIMMLSIFTRIPHFLFLFFPFLFFLISLKVYNINKTIVIKAILLYYIPILLICLISFISLKILNKFDLNIFNEIFNNIFVIFNSINKLFNLDLKAIINPDELSKISYSYFLIYRYIYDFIHVLILTIIFIIGLIIGNIFYNKLENKFFNKKLYNYILLIVIGVLIFLFLNLKAWMWYKATLGFIISILVILKFKKFKFNSEFFYLYWGILLFIISFLGSNNAFRHSIPSGAVFIIFSIIALMNHKRKNEFINKKLIFINKFIYIFFIVILIFSFYKKILNDNKRDTNPIFTRNTMFKSPVLFGIFSNKSRVDAIDGLLNNIKTNIKKDNKVLCFNSIPLIYYLINKDYYLNDPWLIPYKLSNTKNDLESRAVKNQYPDFIIFSKKTALENNWPESNIIIADKDKGLYEYINFYIIKNKYQNIYENNAFILYKK